MSETAPMLEVEALSAWYGAAQILFGLSFSVGRGEVVALMGRNGAGKSTTMKALMGLIAGGDENSLSVQHGIEYLLDTQRAEGNWDEDLATGTGFPKVFYLNYHLYKDYFPLLALTSFMKSHAK